MTEKYARYAKLQKTIQKRSADKSVVGAFFAWLLDCQIEDIWSPSYWNSRWHGSDPSPRRHLVALFGVSIRTVHRWGDRCEGIPRVFAQVLVLYARCITLQMERDALRSELNAIKRNAA